MAIIKKKKLGNVHTKTTLKNNSTKEVIGEEENDTPLGAITLKKGEVLAMVHWQDQFTTSHAFQSFGCQVGITFPFACKPGDLKSIKKAFFEAEELCDEVMAGKINEAPSIIRKLKELKGLI